MIDEGLIDLAEISATVDLERALAERGFDPEGAVRVDDPLLGARVVVLVDGPAPRVALAEPSTEGRLAGWLARHGEGFAGRYRAVRDADTLDDYLARATALGVRFSRVADGPFGRSSLLVASPTQGPFLIVVDRRSIPSRR